MFSAPLVSIIMPVYRGERFIRAAVESVLAQTYRSFELIIVNDGSPDDSHSVISTFLPHPNIRYIERVNGGVAAARNTGLEKATGGYIALLDQDDLWLPDKLERQVAFMSKRPDVGLVHTRVGCIDATGSDCSCAGAIAVYALEGRCAGRLLLGNGIAPLTVLMRATCLADVGRFNQAFAPADDWELWLRIARRYPIGFMDEVSARYRVHADMVSKDLINMQQTVLLIMHSVCERFPDVIASVSADELAVARARSLMLIAEAYENRSQVAEARDYWTRAYRTRRDMNALLALLGVSQQWRRRLCLHGTPLRRFVSWYVYKIRNAIGYLTVHRTKHKSH